MTIIMDMINHFGIAFFPIGQELTFLLIALLFDGATRLLLPDFRDRMAPMGGIVAAATNFMVRKLNRDYRESGVLFIRGSIALSLLLVLSFIAAMLVEMLTVSGPRGQILSVLVVFSCLGVTSPWTVGRDITQQLRKKKVVVSDLLAVLQRRRVMRDVQLKNPDQYGVARTIIEIVGRSFASGFMSVSFWYCVPALLGYSGIVSLLMATAITEMTRVININMAGKSAFATPFTTIDTIVHYIPTRLSGILLFLAMFFAPKMKPFAAIKCLIQQSHKHVSVNAGWPVAMMAGGTNVALASGVGDKKWLGLDNASAKANWQDVRRALTFHYVTFIIALLIISALLFLSIGL